MTIKELQLRLIKLRHEHPALPDLHDMHVGGMMTLGDGETFHLYAKLVRPGPNAVLHAVYQYRVQIDVEFNIVELCTWEHKNHTWLGDALDNPEVLRIVSDIQRAYLMLA